MANMSEPGESVGRERPQPTPGDATPRIAAEPASGPEEWEADREPRSLAGQCRGSASRPGNGSSLPLKCGLSVRRSSSVMIMTLRAAAQFVYASSGNLRMALGQRYAGKHRAFTGELTEAASYQLLWVTDFPMFEWDDDGQRWAAAHHPFTSPHERDMDKLESDPGSVRALAYDVVLNGTELGSGSIRIHRHDIQQKIFHALGMTEQEARSRFGFFLEALEYGTPPHGGIALGLDRIVMILAGADSLREVIPFPKTARAVDLMMDAPTPVSEAQLKDLGIQVKKN